MSKVKHSESQDAHEVWFFRIEKLEGVLRSLCIYLGKRNLDKHSLVVNYKNSIDDDPKYCFWDVYRTFDDAVEAALIMAR